MKTLLLFALFGLASALSAADSTAPRVVFISYNGDPKKPESLDVQINTLDRTALTRFYKVGETIEGTQQKSRRDAQAREVDVSELTLRNVETKETLVLPLGKPVSLRPGAGTQRE